MYQTQTITRGTIKRVETQLRGLAQFDVVTPALKPLIDWITGRTGELKITATEFAEGMVIAMYGTEPNCGMPQPNIPIVPNANPPKFCAGSIAGMIERCRIFEAQSSLDQVDRQFNERTRKNANGTWMYPEGEFVKRWVDQYWNNDKSHLSTAITTARATCGLVGEVPKVCPAGWTFSPTLLKCVNNETGQTMPPTTTQPPGGGLNLSSMTPMLIMGIVGFAILAFAKR